MKTKKKENIIIIVILVVMVLAIIGVSYAAFNFQGLGQRENTITTGDISMTYEEGDNTISIGNALPTTDETGMVRLKGGEYFDFTVSSEITGNVNINYEISAKDITTSDRKIDGSNIKLYLTRLTEDEEEQLMTPETYNEETSTNSFTGRPSGEMSLYTSSMNSSEEHTFRLRMYVTEEYNPQGDGGGLTFTVQVNVYGKAGEKPKGAGETIIENLTSGDTYDDGVDTFITGEDPNNYIWYSGKLWRAISVNNETNTTKLVSEYGITSIPYSSGSSNYEDSFVREWLNDTTVDGFLGNLREPENFIVTDSVWDATMDSNELGSITRPNGTTTVIDAVGLLNTYEYQSGCNNTTFSSCYLNIRGYTMTPFNETTINIVDSGLSSSSINHNYGVRPTINLKNSVQIVDGDGSETNPYRLEGDNDSNLSGTLLNTRYSGEYIRFGTGDNNLYRIVSHENGIGTKITSALVLDLNVGGAVIDFGNSDMFSSTNTIGTFLNNDYLNPDNGYLTSEQVNMIEDNTTWYLGAVGDFSNYKLAKYVNETSDELTSRTTVAKVGLLRAGELLASMASGGGDEYYWTLTPCGNGQNVQIIHVGGELYGWLIGLFFGNNAYKKPSLNLKSNVIITSGLGTKEQPFEIALQ